MANYGGNNKLYTSNQTSPLFCIDKDSNHIKDITGLPVDLLPMDDLQSVSELLGIMHLMVVI